DLFQWCANAGIRANNQDLTESYNRILVGINSILMSNGRSQQYALTISTQNPSSYPDNWLEARNTFASNTDRMLNQADGYMASGTLLGSLGIVAACNLARGCSTTFT